MFWLKFDTQWSSILNSELVVVLILHGQMLRLQRLLGWGNLPLKFSLTGAESTLHFGGKNSLPRIVIIVMCCLRNCWNSLLPTILLSRWSLFWLVYANTAQHTAVSVPLFDCFSFYVATQSGSCSFSVVIALKSWWCITSDNLRNVPEKVVKILFSPSPV